MDVYALREAFEKLESEYRAGESSINRVVLASEALLEQASGSIPPNLLQDAMDCVYIIEDINAVVLDARRAPSESEAESVISQLRRIAVLLKQPPKQDNENAR